MNNQIVNKLIRTIYIFILVMIFLMVTAYPINLVSIYFNSNFRVVGFDTNYPGFPNISLIILLMFGSLYYGFYTKFDIFKKK